MKTTVYFKERTPTPEGLSRAYSFHDAEVDASGPERSVAITWGDEVWLYPFEVIEGVRITKD